MLNPIRSSILSTFRDSELENLEQVLINSVVAGRYLVNELRWLLAPVTELGITASLAHVRRFTDE